MDYSSFFRIEIVYFLSFLVIPIDKTLDQPIAVHDKNKFHIYIDIIDE